MNLICGKPDGFVAALFLAFALVVSTAAGDGDRFASLREHSPFGVGTGTTTRPAAESALEFRGYAYEGPEVVFSIGHFDPTGQFRSDWVALGESRGDYVVRSFDQATDSVQVEYRGRARTLQLKRSRVQLLEAANSSGADPEQALDKAELERLQTVAYETRRRGAIRQAADLANGTGGR